MNFMDKMVLVPAHTSEQRDAPIAHYHTPITTSTSVLGIVYNDGVVIAADMLGSYGSLARFTHCNRILQVNKNVIVGAGGDYSDYQLLKAKIEALSLEDVCMGDGLLLKPKTLHCWLTRVLYKRRSKMDPLWNNILVAGMQNGKPFLATVDKLGTAYEDKLIATGYGAHIALPLLRNAMDENIDIGKEKAIEMLKKCMEILYYRDARSYNKYQLGVIDASGSSIIGPLNIQANWEIAKIEA